MIRVQTISGEDKVTIIVDGQLAGEDVAHIESSVRDAVEPNRTASLFLREVSHIDAAGRKLLYQLAEQGVELTATGVYSSYVVEGIREAVQAQANGGTRKERF